MDQPQHSIYTVAAYRLRRAWDSLRGQDERDAPSKWAIQEFMVRSEMRPQLQAQITLARDVEAFAFGLIRSLDPNKHAPEIFLSHTSLAARSLQDLRIAVIATLDGYTMQGWTAASAAFEAAHMAGFIGTDVERATRWQSHAETDRPFAAVYDTVRGAFGYLEMTKDSNTLTTLVENEYQLYEYLCMGKHSNPLSEKYRYWLHGETTSRLMFTTFYHESRVKEGRLGLGLAARSALLASWVVAKAHAVNFDQVTPSLSALARRTAAGIEHWRDDIADS